jgi:Lysophospholipase L1 and related esterases
MSIQLEYAEWSNFWFENAPNKTAGRIMLIGDSITNGYRRPLQEKFKDSGTLVDMTVGSRGADNPSLYAEIEYAIGSLNGYKYKVVHFNNGLHANHLTADEYEQGMIHCIELIKKLQPEAVIILVTSTPYADEDKNAYVHERNAIVKKLAVKYDLPLDDLFTAVTGDSEYPQPDGVHFTSVGYEHLAATAYNKIAQF